MSVVLLILMLQQLAQLTKRFVAFRTTIRQVWNPVVHTIPSQERSLSHESLHAALPSGIIVDLLTGVILSTTSGAITTLNVLHGVCARSETAENERNRGYCGASNETYKC